MDHFNAAMQDLAARELVIQQIKSTLINIRLLSAYETGTNDAEIHEQSRKALALHPTTTYLDAYVAEKVKEKDAEIERLKVEADPEALHIAYLHGQADRNQTIAAQSEALKLAKELLTKHLRYSHLGNRYVEETLSAINALEK